MKLTKDITKSFVRYNKVKGYYLLNIGFAKKALTITYRSHSNLLEKELYIYIENNKIYGLNGIDKRTIKLILEYLTLEAEL